MCKDEITLKSPIGHPSYNSYNYSSSQIHKTKGLLVELAADVDCPDLLSNSFHAEGFGVFAT